MNNSRKEIMPNAAFIQLSTKARDRLIGAFPQAYERLLRDNKTYSNQNKVRV